MRDRLAPNRWTLRVRLVLLATIAVSLILLVGGGLLLLGLRDALTRSVETTARSQLDTTLLLVASGELPPEIPVTDEEDTVIQVIAADGTVVASSTNVVGEPPIELPRSPSSDRVLAFTLEESPVDDEDEGSRVVATRVAAPSGDAVVVLIAQSLETVDEAVATAARLGGLGLPVLVLVLALVSWVMIGRTLRPVDAIRREADAIGGGDLDRRVPVPLRQDEIGRLATTVNAMLARLEDSARRQERFVGDAAHELRSPIASLRTQLETVRATTRPVDWDDVTGDLLDETRRMQSLTEQLLVLARADASNHELARVPVDLDDILDAVIRAVGPTTEIILERRLDPVQVEGDPVLIALMVRNVMENAIRHATTRVELQLRKAGRSAVFVTSDDGPGIPAPDRERVMERFVRLDQARARNDGGSGLGLAIVADIVRAHRGSVSITDARPGAIVTIQLPIPPARL